MNDTAVLARRVVHGVRARWRRHVLARATLLALATLAAAAIAAVLLDQLLSLPPSARKALRAVPLLAGVWVWLATARRALRDASDSAVALFAERREPALAGWLSTALVATGDGPVSRAFRIRAARILDSASPRSVPLPSLRPSAFALAAALAAAAVVVAIVPGGAAELTRRWTQFAAGPSSTRVAGGGLTAAAEAIESTFGDLELRVSPPSYTGLHARSVRAGDTLSILAGSSVEARGALPFGAGAIDASLIRDAGDPTRAARASLPVASGGGEWAVRWTAEPGQRGLDLIARGGSGSEARRVVAFRVAPDAPPGVTLELPAEDLVLATGAGEVTLRASARDDHGVAAFSLAWIHSRGGGESFSFTDGEWEWDEVRATAGGLTGERELDLGSLDLRPGDVIHVHAAARDANVVSGPGVGVSATRVLRVAREDEMADVSTLIGFPPELDAQPVLSQRMIILLTERLIARAPSIDRSELLRESERIAHEQARLREQVDAVVNARTSGHDTPDDTDHQHDADPILAVNRALLPALDAMFDAERLLRLGEPDSALPHERRALEILQRAREADRIFLRGRQTVAPVDVAGVRGTGELEDARPSARSTAPASVGEAVHADAIGVLAERLPSMTAGEAAHALSALAATLLADAGAGRSGELLAQAAEAARRGRIDDARRLALEARARLAPASGITGDAATPAAADPRTAEYLRAASRTDAARVRGAAADVAPFVFATARYRSGDWDSAQLVPANLIHSLALYTDIPVAPEGVVVDLSSPAIFRYPFLYMTGHLPVRFDDAEAAGLRAYVERGGFVFIDDHNHDIDGAFHRTATAELERIFGRGALRDLPNDHELYRAFFTFEDGPPTTSHELNGWGDGLVHESLSAIERNGRIAVLYSNKDYSSEWSYHVQNKRFQARDNTRFGVNVLVYALTR